MILIIDNYDSFVYNLYQIVAKLYPQVMVVRNNEITLREIYAIKPTGIILSPGPGRPENAGICVKLIQNLKFKLPVLGVCLGHQVITVAFGGKVIQAPEIMHGKPDLIFHQREGLYQGLPLPFQVGRYHSLIAEKSSLPSILKIEAETASGIIMGVRHATLPIHGVQFHPESILTPDGSILLQNFVHECEHVSRSFVC